MSDNTYSGVDDPDLTSHLWAEVIAHCHTELEEPPEATEVDRPLVELFPGSDDLDWVEVTIALEERFDIELPDDILGVTSWNEMLTRVFEAL